MPHARACCKHVAKCCKCCKKRVKKRVEKGLNVARSRSGQGQVKVRSTGSATGSGTGSGTVPPEVPFLNGFIVFLSTRILLLEIFVVSTEVMFSLIYCHLSS